MSKTRKKEVEDFAQWLEEHGFARWCKGHDIGLQKSHSWKGKTLQEAWDNASFKCALFLINGLRSDGVVTEGERQELLTLSLLGHSGRRGQLSDIEFIDVPA